jgi:redox-sensitive bicupin YhaK (pirin superfamily)
MLRIRKSEERGYADQGWLKSFHSFSFANYYDPRFMGWGNLKVINEDRITPDSGFGNHGHRDMEIISYILSGELAHKDSIGNVESIPPGDVQRMSAGTGVIHSEFNHAPGQETHFLQIWIEPLVKGIAPDYEQRNFSASDKQGKLKLIVSPQGDGDSIKVNADVNIFAGLFENNRGTIININPNRKSYVHLIQGSININNLPLKSGDAVFIEHETEIELSEGQAAEVIVFDLSP